MYKKLYLSGWLAYFILFVLAIVLYKERTVFLDTSYLLFHILKDGDFAIQHNRYGSVLTQVFPVVCSKLSLSLAATAIIYSASFVLYYATCYWVCGSLLKQYEVALSLLLFNILFVTDTFYWIPSELPQGIAFLLVLFAVLKSYAYMGNNILHIILLLPLIVMSLFFHPLIILPAVFIIIYFLLNHTRLKDLRIFLATSVLLILLFLLKHYFIVSAYDSEAVKAGEDFFTKISSWPEMYSTRHFFENCLNDYIWLPVCTFIIWVIYIKQRRWFSLMFFSVSLLAYIMLVTTSYPDAYTGDFYMENLFLPLGLFIGLPFVYDVLPQMPKPKVAMLLFFLIVGSGIVRIYLNHDTYTNRLNWQRAILAGNPDKKIVIAETKPIADTLIMTWGSPYEFWLLSTIESGKTASVMVTDDMGKFFNFHKDKDLFITTWDLSPYSTLTSQYFKLTDTVHHYEIVK